MSEPGVSGFQSVGLLEVEPDLRACLAPDERPLVAGVTVPVHVFPPRSLDIDAQLDDAGAFGAVILDGLVQHRMVIGDQPGLRLLGPGDMLIHSAGSRTVLFSESSYRTSGELRLAMLDDRVLLAARRFPRLFAGLQMQLGEQHQRLAAQLVICQLPRVEDRLLTLMWLLAETWGRVTASGTVLPIALTHDTLGELIGARRPTVSLALKELAARGSLLRQDGEWLLLEGPPEGSVARSSGGDPRITPPAPRRWAPRPASAADVTPEPPPLEHSYAELRATIAVLHESHVRSRSEVNERLERARRTRERARFLLEQIARQRLSRQPPSPVR